MLFLVCFGRVLATKHLFHHLRLQWKTCLLHHLTSCCLLLPLLLPAQPKSTSFLLHLKCHNTPSHLHPWMTCLLPHLLQKMPSCPLTSCLHHHLVWLLTGEKHSHHHLQTPLPLFHHLLLLPKALHLQVEHHHHHLHPHLHPLQWLPKNPPTPSEKWLHLHQRELHLN